MKHIAVLTEEDIFDAVSADVETNAMVEIDKVEFNEKTKEVFVSYHISR